MSTTTETERESPLHPGVKLERRLPVFYASFFYAFPAAVAWIWLEAFKPGTGPPDTYSIIGGGYDASGQPLTVTPESDRAIISGTGGLY